MRASVLASSDWLYRRLLRFYPPAFQARFAAEMAQVFRTLSREAYTESGAGGLLGLWLAALWDWAWAVLYQWELFLFKRRVKMMRIRSTEQLDAIRPLSPAHAALAVLPFLLFGLSSLGARLAPAPPSPGYSLAQSLVLHPFLVFNWLVLLGLGTSLYLGFPRWGYPYLGWAILFGWWWMDMRFYGHFLGGWIWLPLLGVVLVALLARSSLQPLRNLLAGLWGEWTLLSLAIYIFCSYMFILNDENHNPYLLALLAATTLAACLGAWGYFRAPSPLRRVLWLTGGFLLITAIAVIDSVTWDANAYYGLPASDPAPAYAPLIVFFLILALVMAGFGLAANWRAKTTRARG